MNLENIKQFVLTEVSKLSIETLNILAIIALHCASIPSMIALLTSITDNAPSLDIFFFVYTGLFLMFLKSFITKDLFGVVINVSGFFVQVILLSMIVFK